MQKDEWWYLGDEDRPIGPIKAHDVREKLHIGEHQSESLIWREGQQEWSAISSHAELLAAPPPSLDKAPSHPEPPAAPDTAQPALKPAPWRRYLARMIDMCTIGLAAGAIVGVLAAMFAPPLQLWMANPGNELLLVILMLPPALLAEVGVYAMFKHTPGKALMGVRICDKQGRPLPPQRYAARQLDLYVRALALGIPIASLITMAAQYSNLKNSGFTSYDQDKHTVRTKPMSAARVVVFIIAAAAVLAANTALTVWSNKESASSAKYWKNPATQEVAFIGDDWLHQTSDNDDGQTVYVFENARNGTVVVFAQESMGALDGISHYAQVWSQATTGAMDIRPTQPETVGNHAGHGVAGRLSNDPEQKITGFATQIGNSVWRTVIIHDENPNNPAARRLQAALLRTLD